MKQVKYIVRSGELEAEMMLGTYPIINLVMTKTRTINDMITKFQYVLTFGFSFTDPDISLISMEDALRLMNDKIDTADISNNALYPNKIDGWIHFEGVYHTSGMVANYPATSIEI